ncbi:MAG: DarT ssDNA thymidine ADP-ribosyltransferase family protein [Gemmataceae bacterium]
MTPMPQLNAESAYIYRITHVKNVAWMLQHGIHCRSSPIQDPDFLSIGNPELIQKRSTRTVPSAPGGSFSDSAATLVLLA